MKIGKLKKGDRFTADSCTTAMTGIVYVVTKSGYGTGPNVDVLFEIASDPNSPTYCAPKHKEVTKYTEY